MIVKNGWFGHRVPLLTSDGTGHKVNEVSFPELCFAFAIPESEEPVLCSVIRGELRSCHDHGARCRWYYATVQSWNVLLDVY